VRHFFHLRTTSPTPDSWELVSDGERIFKPFWVNIDRDPQFVAPQAAWWEFAKHKLKTP
jgi:hypothetical protein